MTFWVKHYLLVNDQLAESFSDKDLQPSHWLPINIHFISQHCLNITRHMPSYPQRAGYQNRIIKNTLPSRQSSWDIYAITAVVFLKDKQVAMCPLVSILSRGTLPGEDKSPDSPHLWNSEHWTPHRDLKGTLQGGCGIEVLSCTWSHNPYLCGSRSPTSIILSERTHFRKNPISDNYILWASPFRFNWIQLLFSSLYVVISCKFYLTVSSSALLGSIL